MDIVGKIIATMGLVIANGYFVAAEFAAVGARTSRIEAEAGNSFLARLSLDIKKRLDLYLSTCQLGITMASLGLGAVTEPAVAALVDPILYWFGVPDPGPGKHTGYAIAIALAISTSLHVVVGEVAPKNWAIFYPDKLLPVLALPLVVFTYIFYPLIWSLNSLSNHLLRISGIHITHDAHGGMPHTQEELKSLLAQAVASGTIAKGNERLLTSAFQFGELKARQIMTPRPEVVHLLLDQPLGQILRTVQNNAYTRLPLCDKDLDHVIGVIHMKDLFNHLKLSPGKLKFIDERDPTGALIAIPTGLPGSAVHVIGSGEINLRQIKRDILFVPEHTAAPKLLRLFQTTQNHMAVVVDEYGATQGVVTLEDVIEEIVGDIADEFDTVGPTPDFMPDGESIRVSGLLSLHDLRERLHLVDLHVNGVDTVSGYIVDQLGRLPRPGDTVQIGGYTAKVLSVAQKRAKQVLLTPTPKPETQPDVPPQT